MAKDQAISPEEEQPTRFDFVSILLYRAYQNTKSVKTFQQWQEHLYKQILQDHEKELKTQEQQKTQDNPQKQQSKNQ